MVQSEETQYLRENSNPPEGAKIVNYYLQDHPTQAFHRVTIPVSVYSKFPLEEQTSNVYVTLPTEEGSNEKCCRICLDDVGDFIAPCKCSGSSKWIHRECLDEWRAKSFNEKDFVACGTCKQPYVLRYELLHDQAKRQYRLLVARDIFLFLAVVGIIFGLCFLTTTIVNLVSFSTRDSVSPEHQTGFESLFVYDVLLSIYVFLIVCGIVAVIYVTVVCCCQCCRTPMTTPHPNDHCCLTCYICMGNPSPACSNAGDCSLGNCDGNGGDALSVVLIVVLVVLMLIAFFALIGCFIWVIFASLNRHFHMLEKRAKTILYPVIDLSDPSLFL